MESSEKGGVCERDVKSWWYSTREERVTRQYYFKIYVNEVNQAHYRPGQALKVPVD
jgi:hypothetical protein